MLLKHVAIIPDGNRRWARKNGFNPEIGHKVAMEVIEKIYRKAIDMNIPYITFWVASVDNLTKRSKREVNFLIKVITQEIEKLLREGRVKRDKARVRVLGKFRKFFPKRAVNLIEKLVDITKKNNLFNFTLLLAYNGTDEILEAIRKITKAARKTSMRITLDLIKSFLWTKDLPPVDLVIRTGCEGDPHNSAGFMMLDTAYSQYYFTRTYFPEFSSEEFEKAVKSFLRRERRFGK